MTVKIRKRRDGDGGWAVLCPLCGAAPGTYGMVTTNVDGDGWLFFYGSQPVALGVAERHIRTEHAGGAS